MVFLVEVDGKLKWRAMLVSVKNPNCIPGTNEPECVPAGFVVCSGKKMAKKLYLTNHMLCDWQVRFKKICCKKDECPYYAPVAQNMHIRSFFSKMGKSHGWQWTESDFQKFKGLLSGVIETLMTIVDLNM